jgi:hypothetical protein
MSDSPGFNSKSLLPEAVGIEKAKSKSIAPWPFRHIRSSSIAVFSSVRTKGKRDAAPFVYEALRDQGVHS